MRTSVLVSIVLLASVSAAAAQDLTGDDIKQKIIGHTWKWKSEKYKAGGVTTYNADGTATSKGDGDAAAKPGTWRIKGNNLCDKYGKDKESCSTRIDQIDDRTFYWEPFQSVSILQP
jgi:hypothetical protein